MPEELTFRDIQDLYFTLDLNFNTLFTACQNIPQQNQFRRDYVNARDAFWEARNRTFIDDDPMVTGIVAELQIAKQSLDADLRNLQDIVQTLKTIDACVSFASRLIAIGATGI
jgi:hypothetical protein